MSGTTITINDTTSDTTYPDFARAAARHGIRHTMSTGLPVRRHTIGGLNIYGTGETPFDDTTTLAANLQRALESRAIIDQAKGILVGGHGMSAEAAFDELCKRSQATNRKVRDLAADLAAEAQRGHAE